MPRPGRKRSLKDNDRLCSPVLPLGPGDLVLDVAVLVAGDAHRPRRVGGPHEAHADLLHHSSRAGVHRHGLRVRTRHAVAPEAQIDQRLRAHRAVALSPTGAGSSARSSGESPSVPSQSSGELGGSASTEPSESMVSGAPAVPTRQRRWRCPATFGVHPAAPPLVDLKRRRRRLLETTKTLENAIARPASIGLSRPAAARGSAATL